ncbi:MAG: GNAT family N-acetyltransferase, partial [Clostridia bacterium]|nr:GNAT family N-acetyltransferase [Clostridia bacterium]
VINKNLQGKGYGTTLLNYGVQIAKSQKCDVIELTSNFSREDAHRFYERNGFKKSSYKFKMKL